VVKAAPPPAPQPPPPPPPGGGGPGPTVQHPHPKPAGGKTTPSKPPEPTTSPFGSPIVHVPSPKVHPKLAAGNYVFPVYGPVSYTDTFGSPRADVGWHHGDDIFAPLGAPVLAVANGTVFSVGWNDLGGNRLWLKDSQGNEFYYAHLSAYSPLAANGARVKAGDVLGFVGNTGDAITTPYHLHFEIHPVSLLFKGYDGVVDPTGYLNAWRRLRDLSFSGGVTPSSATYAARTKTSPSAPLPGVVLLKSADISSASGLDERSIRRALAAELDVAANEGLGAVVGAPGSAGAPKG
jgi:murein DD-endopeptidase MepM/ murein hydrolase activator NlpD